MSQRIKHPGLELLLAARNAVLTAHGDPGRAALLLKKAPGAVDTTALELALELALGERKAAELGISWPDMQVTRLALEQASKPPISSHHAKQFNGCRHVLEIGTGLGLDTMALSRCCEQVTTLESDEGAAARAEHNFKSNGLTNITVVAQPAEVFLASRSISEFDGLWADPSRRNSRQTRVKSHDEYAPKLEYLMDLAQGIRTGIKISPAVDVSALIEARPGWQREFLGGRDDCREQILWKLPESNSNDTIVSVPEQSIQITLSSTAFPLEPIPPEEVLGGFVYEFHPAVYAGHIASSLANSLDLRPLGSEQGYYASATQMTSPWVTSFKVLEMHPLRASTLHSAVQALGWNSRTEIKKRGVEDSPEEVRRWLKLPSPSRLNPKFGVVLCFSPDRRRKVALLAERIDV